MDNPAPIPHSATMPTMRKTVGLALALTAIGAVLLAERVAPLRPPTRAKLPRITRNTAMGAACQAVIMASEAPITAAIARRNARTGRGIAGLFGGRSGRLAAFLLLDYTYYLWHVATHKVPFLWRFHRVHHIDPDLDMSTALRFHAADMLVSTPMRMAQLRLSGADPATHDLWRGFFLASVLFHHSNLRLPDRVDRMLRRVIATPRLHGIHHSDRRELMDSNWTAGLTVWDRLHGTYRDDIAQQAITIGVADEAAPGDIPLAPSLAAPFRDQAQRGG